MKGKQQILDPIISKLVNGLEGSLILDYGCGEGQLTEKLALNSRKIIAYDISKDIIRKSKAKNKDNNIIYLDSDEYSRVRDSFEKKIDIILCSLVLCTIESEDIFISVIEDLSYLLHDRGKLVIAVCNPLFFNVKETEIQFRLFPSRAKYNSIFTYEKKSKITNRIRKEVHRPLRIYENSFNNFGLEIEKIIQTPGIDMETGFYASDFMIFIISKLEKYAGVEGLKKTR